jgi:carboxypeptidase T
VAPRLIPAARRASAWLLLVAVAAGTLAVAPAQAPPAAFVPRQTPAPPEAGLPPLSPAALLVVRIYYFNLADRDQLAAEYDAVEAPTTAGYVTALVSPDQHATLLDRGYRVEIDQARTALIAAPVPGDGGGGGAAGIPDYECFRTVEETYADMAALAAAHPTLAAWNDIGDSWEKVASSGAAGHDIYVLVLTNQARPGPKPVFFLLAAIHAREYATAELAARYAEYLLANYGVDPDVTWLLDHFEIHILPQGNPDGRVKAEGGILHRKNANSGNGGVCLKEWWNHWGTDLNRNSSFGWGGAGSVTDPCAQTYRGPAAQSEPETQAIEAYALAHFADQRGSLITDTAPAATEGLFITLHSFGRLVLFPWGNTTDPAPNAEGLRTLGRKFGYFNSYQVCQPSLCLYLTSGTTDDFIYGELGVPAYTFELGDWFFESCSVFESDILPANLPALLYAAKSARRPYQTPLGPDTLQVSASPARAEPGALVTLSALADDTRYNSGGYGVEPVQSIAAARYTVGAPAWVTGTLTYPLAAADGVFDAPTEGLTAQIDTTGWPLGRYLVLVESQDADGHWGAPSAVFLWIVEQHFFPLVRR